VVVYALRSH